MSLNPGATVCFNSVSRAFPQTGLVLDKISLTITPGQFIAFLGPSGCGKSTLLRLAAHLDQPNDGTLVVDSTLHPLLKGYVFQDPTLMPWRTVLSNVLLPLELLGWNSRLSQKRGMEELERVGLADAAKLYPNQLSGGMKMRVSVARALITQPALLLFDEPFSALDEPTRHTLQEELHLIWRSLRMTVLFVTHSPREAAFLAQKIILLTQRPARILKQISVDLPEHRGPELRHDAKMIELIRELSS